MFGSIGLDIKRVDGTCRTHTLTFNKVIYRLDEEAISLNAVYVSFISKLILKCDGISHLYSFVTFSNTLLAL